LKSSNEWINISDLMSVLMMVFLFISVLYMYEVQKEQKSIELIATSYKDTNENIQQSMQKIFKNNLQKWSADIKEDNRIVFFSPDVVFKTNKTNVASKFKIILDDFFPQLIKVLNDEKIKDEIAEIRIEGHSNKQWANKDKDGYIGNMSISQQRALEVLQYCISIDKPIIKNNKKWLQSKLIAVGMSYSKPYIEDNTTNWTKSKRVEFKIVTKSKDKLFEILEKIKSIK